MIGLAASSLMWNIHKWCVHKFIHRHTIEMHIYTQKYSHYPLSPSISLTLSWSHTYFRHDFMGPAISVRFISNDAVGYRVLTNTAECCIGLSSTVLHWSIMVSYPARSAYSSLLWYGWAFGWHPYHCRMTCCWLCFNWNTDHMRAQYTHPIL